MGICPSTVQSRVTRSDGQLETNSARNTQPRSGAGGRPKKPYMYLQQLMYLAPTMGTRQSSDNMETTATERDVEPVRSPVVDSDAAETVTSSSSQHTHQELPASAALVMPSRKRDRSVSSEATSVTVEMQQEVMHLLQR
ncbi:hypothetical protein GDO78_021881 [Eleutherodactylus coqui]|uniref:Uncharacterized protein n=1 Tax=Eleutherodactylus coqui TaxID=57060 RepID=A0A8J6B571_ELECQ|nr:hypothetical protein GDO78_021881 [Eleutherodactylus coqui]